MRTMQKAAIFLIAAISFAAFFSVSSAQKTSGENKNFSDVSEKHPFAASIGQLKNKGLVKGYADGTFAPDTSVSRAEFITMVMASINKNPQGKNCFKDVKDEWFAKFVCAARAKGFVKGYADGTFKPANNINFAEASAIIAQANSFKPAKAKTGEKWYKPAVDKLAAKAAIPVSIDYPEKNISRAETSEIIWRLKMKVTNKPTKTFAALDAEFPSVSSCAELKEKIDAYQYSRSRQGRIFYGGGLGAPMMKTAMPMAEVESIPESAEGMQTTEDSAGAAGDYSSTNVQVEGVDEADVVKNDGEFIYMLSGNVVRIVRAVPPDQMEQITRYEMTDVSFTPADLYVAGNKLVIIGHTYKVPMADQPPVYMTDKTKVYIIDMTDKSNLKEDRSIEFDGTQISSRRIGGRLYLVVNAYPDYYEYDQNKPAIEEILPHFKDSKTGRNELVSGCVGIHFLPRYREPNFLVVASINIEDSSARVDKETILGAGDTVYSSVENLYVTANRYEYPLMEKFDVFAAPQGTQKTAIYSFGLNNGDVVYKGQGEVPGTILNQFSMDESGNAFRIATTTGEVWNTQNPSKNNLYILDKENLGTVLGKIENIAPGEKIYSVRFLGKRAYMVTFKKVDPFFVIDVSNPADPRILGALKIPGYSDYLHPFDENHIIGFGKDTVDPREIEDKEEIFFMNRGFDFAWYQGMKIALFDVTDVANPILMFNEMIGDRGTDSELLRNHKALMYDKARNLFAFPVKVTQIKDKTAGSYTGSQYGETVFQGAYVYTLDLQNGFQLKGKLAHFDADEKSFNPRDLRTINRIVYIGDYLYTISTGLVKSFKREDMSEAGKVRFSDVVDRPHELLIRPK